MIKTLTNLKYTCFIVLCYLSLCTSCKKERSGNGFPSINKQPIAIAGPDLVITLPIDSVLLDGRSSSDADGKISGWRWTKISGPASFTIISPFESITKFKAFVPGIYQFELSVTDNGGLSAKDSVMVTVKSSQSNNLPPVYYQDSLTGKEFIFNNLEWTHAGPGAIAEEEIWIGVGNRPDLFRDPQRPLEVSVKFDTSSVWLNIPKWDGTITPSSIGFVHLIMYQNSFYVESYPMNFLLVDRKATLKIKFL